VSSELFGKPKWHLAAASAASALTFGVLEFVFYWCLIVGLAIAAWKAGLGVRRAAP
jgi:hypothetical protein